MTLKTRSARAKQAIQDQAMAELQDLIAEVDQLMSGTGSLAGKEARTCVNRSIPCCIVVATPSSAPAAAWCNAARRPPKRPRNTSRTIPGRTIAVSAGAGFSSACWWAAARRFRRQQKASRSAGFSAKQGLGSGGDRRLQRPTQFPGSLQGFRLVTAGEGAGPHGAVHHQDPTGQQSLAAQRFGNGRPHQHGDFDSGHRLTPVIISLLIISARPCAMKHAAHNSLFHLRQNYPPLAPTAALPSRRL